MSARAFAALCCLAIGCALPAPAGASVGGVKDGRAVMLVANAEGGTVSVVDALTFRVLKEINVLPDGPDATLGEDNPQQALIRQQVVEAAGGKNYAQDQDVSLDGRTLYVSRGHRGDIAAFDIAGGKMLWKLSIPGFRSDHMTISRDGRRLYVSALTENVVVVVDTRSRRVVGSFPTGQWPHDNHLSEDGRRLYNGSIGNIIVPQEVRGATPPAPYQLTVADPRSLRVLRSFRFERGIRPIVLSHDERRMWAQQSYMHGLIEFDLVRGRISRSLELPVDAGVTEDDFDFEAPHHGLAVDGDERTLCAAGRASDYVALVSTRTLRATAIIDVDDAPGWAATSPDGELCFVANTRADTIAVISYSRRAQIARIRAGDGPKQIEAARLPDRVVCGRPGVPGCCLSRRAPVGARGIGRVRLNRTRRQLVRRTRTRPIRRTRHSHRWCTRGSRGRVVAVFSSRFSTGRALLVASTARGHGNRGVRPGSSVRRLRRAYPRLRRVGRGLYRAAPAGRRMFGVRHGRVRFVGVASRRLLRSPRALRRHLRRAGL